MRPFDTCLSLGPADRAHNQQLPSADDVVCRRAPGVVRPQKTGYHTPVAPARDRERRLGDISERAAAMGLLWRPPKSHRRAFCGPGVWEPGA